MYYIPTREERLEEYKKEAKLKGWDASHEYAEIQDDRKWVSKEAYEGALQSMNSMHQEIQALEKKIKHLQRDNEWLRKKLNER